MASNSNNSINSTSIVNKISNAFVANTLSSTFGNLGSINISGSTTGIDFSFKRVKTDNEEIFEKSIDDIKKSFKDNLKNNVLLLQGVTFKMQRVAGNSIEFDKKAYEEFVNLANELNSLKEVIESFQDEVQYCYDMLEGLKLSQELTDGYSLSQKNSIGTTGYGINSSIATTAYVNGLTSNATIGNNLLNIGSVSIPTVTHTNRNKFDNLDVENTKINVELDKRNEKILNVARIDKVKSLSNKFKNMISSIKQKK